MAESVGTVTMITPPLTERFGWTRTRDASAMGPASSALAWTTLPTVAQLYVSLVMLSGGTVLWTWMPRHYPRPALFFAVLTIACLSAASQVNLPIPLTSGSTLSVSYAAKVMALLLLGPRQAVLIAVAAAFAQCTYKPKQPHSLYRTTFSVSAEALSMAGMSVAYAWLAGPTALMTVSVVALAKPLVGAVSIYFLFNTALLAGAIALSTQKPITKVWRDDFLWSGITFMVAGSAAAVAAVVIVRGEFWVALMLGAPIYFTYSTYQLFVARLDDQQRHMAEMGRLHEARHELLEREQAARAAAEEANRLKDQFLAIVSHELRTPLNAILGWTDMLRKGVLDEERRDRAYQAVWDSAQRQAQLIEELLDVARIVSGKLRLDISSVDLGEVTRAALNVVQPAADAKDVQVTFDADEMIGPIDADKARFQQIAWNLVSNAIKFTPNGGSVAVRLRRTPVNVELIVADTGQGIPDGFLKSVFEPFRQADESTTRANGGLGLGLSIVKHLVEAHGGTISVYSAGADQGSTFTVRLPVPESNTRRSDTGHANAATAPALPRHAPSLKGLSVLVVDDDEEGRLIVAAQLEAHHARVFTASSVAQALDLVRSEHIDVVLADIAMPGEDGYTLIRKLRAQGSPELASIPAAALTAFARNEDRIRALRAGFQSHLAKPIDADLLVTTVARLGGKLHRGRHRRGMTLN